MNEPEVVSLIAHQAVSPWLFGEAMAHDTSLALWFLASFLSSFVTVGSSPYLFFFLIFIYLFIFWGAVLDLCFCARASSSCGKWEPLFIAVRGPLTVAASLVAEHRLQTRRLSSCGSQA